MTRQTLFATATLILASAGTIAGELSTALGGEPACAPDRSKYLLLDARIVDRTDNARLAVGTVKKHTANPLFREDRPWEVRFDNLYAFAFRST